MKLNVAVFFGGESVEHEVSIISAHQAIEALDKSKYEAIPIYVSKDRRLFSDEAMKDIHYFTGKKLDTVINASTQVILVKEGNKVVLKPLKQKLLQGNHSQTIDVALPVMHGTNGEDGTIQGYLEMLKLPYVGCDIYGASVGQDKVLQKHILHDNNLPITNWFWCYASDIDTKKDEVLDKVHKLIYPVILKPSRTGSSVGISVASNDEEYLAAFAEARQYDEKIITEKVVKPMREINCSVIGDGANSETSVLEEVNHSSDVDILDFKNKYQGGSKKTSGASKGMASTARIVPAPLEPYQTTQIEDLAKETFKVLGAAGVCRIDFIMDSETKTIYINEINTIPGSLAFYLWQEKGVDFTSLLDKLIDIALERERRREKMTFSYDTDLLETYQGGSKGVK